MNKQYYVYILAAVALGKLGGSKGDKPRANKLTLNLKK
jgi:hypothetical protein